MTKSKESWIERNKVPYFILVVILTLAIFFAVVWAVNISSRADDCARDWQLEEINRELADIKEEIGEIEEEQRDIWREVKPGSVRVSVDPI
jgi:hypothetical protein